MAAGPEHPDPLELAADRRPLAAVLRREPVAEGAVREAELKARDRLARRNAPLLQVRQRLRRLLQALVVVGDHLEQEPCVLGPVLDRRRELHDRRALHGASGG